MTMTTLHARACLFAAFACSLSLAGCFGEDPDDDDDEDPESSSSELAAPGAWQLPPAVHAAGQRQFVRYDGAPPWRGGAGCSGGILGGTREVSSYLQEIFPTRISSIQGYACRPNTGNRSQTSVHGTGRALDIFIPTVRGAADNGRGDVVANWLVQNAENIGVQFIIWDRATWNASRSGNKVRGYTGPNPHVDHIHLEINADAAARRTAFFTGPRPGPGGALSGSPPADLAGVVMNGAGTGRVELHVTSASNYRQFIEHEATPLPQASRATGSYAYADYDGDGRPDLFFFARGSTGSGRLEVHVLSGASDFQSYLLQTPTPITSKDADDFVLREGDFDRDGRPDLYAIKVRGTAGRAEVHVLSGASRYQQFVVQRRTPAAVDPAADFQVGDYDGDGRADVFLIARSNTGTRSTEVHVLSAASSFERFAVQTGTGLHETPGASWSFAVGDADRDGRADLFAINSEAGTNTEVHALSAASGFRLFAVQSVTGFGRANTSQWMFLVR